MQGVVGGGGGTWKGRGSPQIRANKEKGTELFLSNGRNLSLDLEDFFFLVPVNNDYNSDATHYCFPGKIKDLISKDAVDEATKMVLVNAIYFKGKWQQQFKAEDTVDAPFRISKVVLHKANGLRPSALQPVGTDHFGIIEGINFKCTGSFQRLIT